MFRRLILALSLALVPFSAAAFDLSNMTDEERAAFRAEIRDYLLENPEVLIEAISVLESREAEAAAERDVALVAANREALISDPRDWTGGNPEGDVVLVEFLDYRCGFCKRAHPEVAALLAADPGIRLVIKEFPILGEQSLQASKFALAVKLLAGDDAYKAASDALMEMRTDITPASLRRLAESLGLDADAVMAAMDDPAVMEQIRDTRLLGQAMEITGTPTFVMGDTMLRGYLPADQMAIVAAEERAAR